MPFAEVEFVSLPPSPESLSRETTSQEAASPDTVSPPQAEVRAEALPKSSARASAPMEETVA